MASASPSSVSSPPCGARTSRTCSVSGSEPIGRATSGSSAIARGAGPTASWSHSRSSRPATTRRPPPSTNAPIARASSSGTSRASSTISVLPRPGARRATGRRRRVTRWPAASSSSA